MSSRTRRLISTGCAAVLALSVAAPALADDVADFYKRQRITIYIGYSAGGGYDQYARLLARHMSKHIPGEPSIIVQNRPGAGSLVLANELYNKHPADGSVFGTIGRGIPMEPLFGNDKARFDAAKFTWIGSMNNEVSVCASWTTSKIKTAEDMLTQPWVVGGTGAGADTDIFPLVINNTLGAKMKLITGYPGGAEINLAMERGELDGRCGWSWSSVKSTAESWLKEKKINILFQMSSAKHPELPDVPFVLDYAKNERDRKVLELVYARQAWGRPFLGPPGIPEDRAKALQAAFDATMTDGAFLAEAKKQRMEISPVSGAEIHKLIVDLYKTPPEIVKAASAAVSETGKTSIAKAVIPTETLSGEIKAIDNGGRRVSLGGGGKTVKLRVSGSRTKIKVAGADASRKALKVGMACEVTYQGSSAKAFACK